MVENRRIDETRPIQMAATSVKIMLKVLYNKSPQNLYIALVHRKEQGPDEIRRLTEQNKDDETPAKESVCEGTEMVSDTF